jgi:hypothetical protein
MGVTAPSTGVYLVACSPVIGGAEFDTADGAGPKRPPASLRGVAQCGNDIVLLPSVPVKVTGGAYYTATGQLEWYPTNRHWYVSIGNRVIRLTTGRNVASCADAQSLTRTVLDENDCGDDSDGSGSPPYGGDPSAPTNGATQGSDGNWYSPSGAQLSWCSSCYSNGGWVENIGQSGPANPSYDPSLQPFVTAGQFANQIEPWFYAFALPLDIPVGSLAGKLGSLLSRIANRALASKLSALAAAVGSKNFSRVTANSLNSTLPGVTAQTPAFVVGSQAAQFTANAGFDANFASDLVRVIGDNGTESGSWWTTIDQISNADGSLMSPQQIQNVLALPQTPTTIVYAASVPAGTTGYMGLIAPNFGQAGGAIQFWFPSQTVVVRSVAPLP